MKRWTDKSKIPKSWVYCEKCDRAYGWVNCRVSSGGVEYCLECFGKMKKEVALGKTVDK